MGVGDIGLEERGGCVFGVGENRLPSTTGRNTVQVQDNRGVATLLRIVRVHVEPVWQPRHTARPMVRGGVLVRRVGARARLRGRALEDGPGVCTIPPDARCRAGD